MFTFEKKKNRSRKVDQPKKTEKDKLLVYVKLKDKNNCKSINHNKYTINKHNKYNVIYFKYIIH